MNELQIFNSPEFGQARIVTIDGEPWFIAKDVATALGYSNTRDAIAKHVDDDDKNTVVIRDGKGNPNQTICRMESDGRLKRLYGLPGTFYRAADVLALCEYEEPAHGPLEWERLEGKNKALSEENRALKGVMGDESD